jgi:phage terminase large subunit-like protein
MSKRTQIAPTNGTGALVLASEPCPSWCTLGGVLASHRGAPTDECWGKPVDVEASLEEYGDPDYDQRPVATSMPARRGDTALVVVGVEVPFRGEARMADLTLTVAEAREYARQVLAAADQAEADEALNGNATVVLTAAEQRAQYDEAFRAGMLFQLDGMLFQLDPPAGAR